ncbi:MAG: HAD family phosphatase [Acidobacteria bacterium]|nr:HAD family phosphatase [Acidobacteriota bacterium]
MPPSESIKAVVFDVGGVLTSPLRETFEKISAGGVVDLAKVGPQFRDTFMVGHDGDLPSHRLERGEITIDEFVATLGEARDAVWTLMHPESPHSLFTHVTPHAGMHGLVDDARRAGYKTGIVSNIFTEYIPRWDQITNHVGRFDSVVYSCSVGVRKPNKAIFDIALAELALQAHEVLFIDDTIDMVAAARNYGFVAVEVADHATAIAEARSILAI